MKTNLRNGLLCLVWKNLTGLYKPFWNELQCFLRLSVLSDLSDALLSEWEQISLYLQKNAAVIIAKGGPTCIDYHCFEINSPCGGVVQVSILLDIIVFLPEIKILS